MVTLDKHRPAQDSVLCGPNRTASEALLRAQDLAAQGRGLREFREALPVGHVAVGPRGRTTCLPGMPMLKT